MWQEWKFRRYTSQHTDYIGETARGGTKAATPFPATLSIKEGNYSLEFIFNVDETDLFLEENAEKYNFITWRKARIWI